MHTEGDKIVCVWEGLKCFDKSLPLITIHKIIHQALDILEERHGRIVRDSFETGVVKKWQLDNHAHGAFVIHDVYQRNDLTVSKTVCA